MVSLDNYAMKKRKAWRSVVTAKPCVKGIVYCKGDIDYFSNFLKITVAL